MLRGRYCAGIARRLCTDAAGAAPAHAPAPTHSSMSARIVELDLAVKQIRAQLADAGVGRRRFWATKHAPPPASLPLLAGRVAGPDLAQAIHGLLQALMGDPAPLEYDCCRLLLCLGSAQLLAEAERLFQHARRHFPLSADLYSAMLYCYGRTGDYDRALDLFRAVSEQQHATGIPVSRKMYHALMESYVSALERQIVCEQSHSPCYGFLRTADPVYPVVLEQQLRRLSLDPLLAIYAQLLASRLPPTIETITIVLRAAGRLRRPDLIARMRQEAERLGLALDAQAFEVLLFALYQCGLDADAEAAHEEALAALGLAHCPRLLNVALCAYSRKNDWPAAKRILDRYAAAGVSANASALSYLVALAARHDLACEAEALLATLKDRQAPLPPAAITYNQILALHLRRANHPAFLAVVQEMRAGGVELDRYSRTMLFDLLGRIGDAQLARDEFQRLRSAADGNRTWSAMELSALFTCFFKVCRPEMIAELILLVNGQQWLNQLGHAERLDVNLALIRAFGLIGDWTRAWSLAQELVANEARNKSSADPAKSSRVEIVALRSFLSVILETKTPSPLLPEVLALIQAHKVYRDPALLALIMKVAESLGDFGTVHALWAEVAARRKITSLALESYCEALLRDSNNRHQIPRLLAQHRTKWTPGLALIQLKLLLLDGDQVALLHFFKSLPDLGVRVGVEHCNVLLSGGNADYTIEWMLRNAVFSNTETMNVLLSCGTENLDAGIKLIDMYLECGRRPAREQVLRLLSAL